VLPVAFANEIKELVESSYQAKHSGNITRLIENSVITGGEISLMTEKQAYDAVARRLNDQAIQMQQQAEANGGINRFEIGDIDISTDYYSPISGDQTMDTLVLTGAVGVTIIYNNNKTADDGYSFIFHQGQWKLKYRAGL